MHRLVCYCDKPIPFTVTKTETTRSALVSYVKLEFYRFHFLSFWLVCLVKDRTMETERQGRGSRRGTASFSCSLLQLPAVGKAQNPEFHLGFPCECMHGSPPSCPPWSGWEEDGPHTTENLGFQPGTPTWGAGTQDGI